MRMPQDPGEDRLHVEDLEHVSTIEKSNSSSHGIRKSLSSFRAGSENSSGGTASQRMSISAFVLGVASAVGSSGASAGAGLEAKSSRVPAQSLFAIQSEDGDDAMSNLGSEFDGDYDADNE